jgi:hypothetical protein
LMVTLAGAGRHSLRRRLAGGLRRLPSATGFARGLSQAHRDAGGSDANAT